MAKTDQTAFRIDNFHTSIDSKTTLDVPTLGHHALTIRISHRRPFRLLRSRPVQRLVYLALALAGLQLYLLHSEYYGALIAKYSPTLFTRLSLQNEDLLASTHWQVDKDDTNGSRQQLLDNRQQWKRLGSGCEGDTFSFNDSVIKFFKPRRSPLRNCMPNTASKMRWPPEIPASLILGGLSDRLPDRIDFLPVFDYFLLPTSGSGSDTGQWHLVTPFLKSGTLEHLARRLQSQKISQTAEDIDVRYRSSFNRLLKALSTMHSQHELCHDDIKMDNIFVTDVNQSSNQSTTPSEKNAHWLLADLGNARQPAHSYHSSLLWAHDNSQNTDCRINDVVRLVKSYVLFLQSAVMAGEPRDTFNGVFLTASAPWSRLYWYTINSAYGRLNGTTAARQILAMSSGVFTPGETATRSELPWSSAPAMEIHADGGDDWEGSSRPRLQRSSWGQWIWSGLGGSVDKAGLVRQQLRMGMKASERWAKIYGTFGVLPIPSEQC
ncbi:hypothetical protein J7T55_004227 [Diaporthe amygdali]|uniref:uncharacterized protein n=1 Tax=Phomopsis amygdali TaxID=1214568 RepID=UPI0022FED9C9|nr:uncharacterized protein J7T55_004227 [Diaporthe amygdali]KAJ0103902.1 hypothetical protein J7T55_004227 [Diaporthe amygdali]